MKGFTFFLFSRLAYEVLGIGINEKRIKAGVLFVKIIIEVGK
jgi:hypothetical protein